MSPLPEAEEHFIQDRENHGEAEERRLAALVRRLAAEVENHEKTAQSFVDERQEARADRDEWFRRHEIMRADVRRLAARCAALEKVAIELDAQVYEFRDWDKQDWPAAYAALVAHASSARAALSSTATAGVPTKDEELERKNQQYKDLYALWCRVARAMTPSVGPDITDEQVADRAEQLAAHVARVDGKLARLFDTLERYPAQVDSRLVKEILWCGHDNHARLCPQCGTSDAAPAAEPEHWKCTGPDCPCGIATATTGEPDETQASPEQLREASARIDALPKVWPKAATTGETAPCEGDKNE